VKRLLIPILALAPSLAFGDQLMVERQSVMNGKNELSAQLGFQAGMGASTPTGAKLFIDYSRYIKSFVWFNVKLNPTFALDSRGTCYDVYGNAYTCGGGSSGDGHAIDALAGVKLKFPLKYKLMPYVNLDAGVVGIYARPTGDNGVAVILRPGAGLKWFATPHVAVGGEFNFGLGGGFYSETCNGCKNGHNEFYRAFDAGIGAEFIL
jgi:hypothetical protein